MLNIFSSFARLASFVIIILVTIGSMNIEAESIMHQIYAAIVPASTAVVVYVLLRILRVL